MRLRARSREIDMLNGPIMPGLLRFAIPLILSSMLQLTFNAADVVVVGRFEGDAALAAVGAPGALIAKLGEVTPSIIVILCIAAVLKSFRNNRYVDRAFYGLRPASTGLIGAAFVGVALEVLTGIEVISSGMANHMEVTGPLIQWKAVALAAALLVMTNCVKKLKNLHPIIFITLSAVVGIMFRFAGV